MGKISYAELYRIINHSIEYIGKCSTEPVNKEMAQFVFEYRRLMRENIQLRLFDEYWPLKDEIRQAVCFCDDLERYRLATDAYARELLELNEDTWRRLYNGIQCYRPHIEPENLSTLTGMEKGIKYHLPEFRPMLLMQDYNNKLMLVFREKKIQQKHKKKGLPIYRSYEKEAKALFEEILRNKELKSIRPCQEKIEFFQNCLKLVDCLPKEQYTRSRKFHYKYRINLAILQTARSMENPDMVLIKETYFEACKFRAAEERALSYSNDENIRKALRDKKMRDDWIYK